MRPDVIDFTILTSDLADLATRLRNRGWLNTNNRPRYGVHFVRLAPKVLLPAVYDENGNEITPAVMDTLHRIYVRVYAGKMIEEQEGDRIGAVAFWTKLGAWVRANGVWDETRKAWQVGTNFWLVKETDIVPDHEWQ